MRLAIAWRIAWTLSTLVIVQIVVCGLAAMPVVLVWQYLIVPPTSNPLIHLVLVSAAIVPSYVAFAVCLMVVAPLAWRVAGWRTPDEAHLPLADLDWALLRWVRYGASIHLVRILSGSLFRGTPIWTAHLRLGGARLGRRVYVNSLGLNDYNLLEFGDDVVIGGGVHVSGHTVEAGVLKTARVRLDRNVTIGLESVVEIGVEIGADTQIGALSFVPKHTKLAGGAIYAGVPAVRIHSSPSEGH